jgi:hypothetical protein
MGENTVDAGILNNVAGLPWRACALCVTPVQPDLTEKRSRGLRTVVLPNSRLVFRTQLSNNRTQRAH